MGETSIVGRLRGDRLRLGVRVDEMTRNTVGRVGKRGSGLIKKQCEGKSAG